MNALARRILYLVVIGATAACGGNEGTGPMSEADPGFVRVTVSGPVAPLVAYKFRLAGERIDSVRAPVGTMFFESIGPALARVIVLDDADANRLVEFWIPDRGQLSGYVVNLEEVAATDSYQNLSVADYTVSLAR